MSLNSNRVHTLCLIPITGICILNGCNELAKGQFCSTKCSDLRCIEPTCADRKMEHIGSIFCFACDQRLQFIMTISSSSEIEGLCYNRACKNPVGSMAHTIEYLDKEQGIVVLRKYCGPICATTRCRSGLCHNTCEPVAEFCSWCSHHTKAIELLPPPLEHETAPKRMMYPNDLMHPSVLKRNLPSMLKQMEAVKLMKVIRGEKQFNPGWYSFFITHLTDQSKVASRSVVNSLVSSDETLDPLITLTQSINRSLQD